MLFHANSEDSDLSLRWEHRSFCWFCRAAAQLSIGLEVIALYQNQPESR